MKNILFIITAALSFAISGCGKKEPAMREAIALPKASETRCLTRVDRAPGGAKMHRPPRCIIKIRKSFADDLDS